MSGRPRCRPFGSYGRLFNRFAGAKAFDETVQLRKRGACRKPTKREPQRYRVDVRTPFGGLSDVDRRRLGAGASLELGPRCNLRLRVGPQRSHQRFERRGRKRAQGVDGGQSSVDGPLPIGGNLSEPVDDFHAAAGLEKGSSDADGRERNAVVGVGNGSKSRIEGPWVRDGLERTKGGCAGFGGCIGRCGERADAFNGPRADDDQPCDGRFTSVTVGRQISQQSVNFAC
jgi:hypothetical protein